MTSPVAQLLELASAQAGEVAPYVARLVPVAMSCPFLGGPAAPLTVRVGLAIVLGVAAHGAFAGAGGAPLPLALQLARELGIGVVLAFVAAIPFEAARAGGRLVDTLRGATLAELHVAPMRQRESATGDLLSHWTVVLAASAGGDRLVVTALLATFDALPVGATFSGAANEALLSAGAEVVACAAAIGAPAAAGLVAADLAVSAAARLAPSMSVPALVQPARAATGLLAVAIPAALLAGKITAMVAASAGLLRLCAGAAR